MSCHVGAAHEVIVLVESIRSAQRGSNRAHSSGTYWNSPVLSGNDSYPPLS